MSELLNQNTFEELGNHYKPDVIEVLFVGESRPAGGTFFLSGIQSLTVEEWED
jgi:hypothetical protein